MARQLWLLRHGEAVPHDSRPADAERELTRRGEAQAEVAGAALAALAVEFAACYASPKVRAWDTARLACGALGIEPVEEAVLGDGFEAADALALLRRHDEDARVLVVGHEPSFSGVVGALTGARMDFKKGGVAAVRVAGAAGEVMAVLRPRDLAAIAAAE